MLRTPRALFINTIPSNFLGLYEKLVGATCESCKFTLLTFKGKHLYQITHVYAVIVMV